MGLAGGAVAGVEGHEVLDVGCDQGTTRVGGVAQDLVIGQPDESPVGYDGGNVMALGA